MNNIRDNNANDEQYNRAINGMAKEVRNQIEA